MINVKQVKITTEFITLGQLLKIVDIASSGGEAKILVKELEMLKYWENREHKYTTGLNTAYPVSAVQDGFPVILYPV